MLLPESKLRELRERLADVPQRIATVAKRGANERPDVGADRPGRSRARESLATGARNPSQVYRVHAANTPDKPAIMWRDQTISFAELDRRIDAIAASLSAAASGAERASSS